MNDKFGLLFDKRYLRHSVATVSLENPERLRNLNAVVTDQYQGRYIQLPPREATAAEVEAVHSGFYLDQIREHMLNPDPYSYDPDTYLMEDSLVTARLAAGGCLALADGIMDGHIGFGYAMVRPPGHHAEPGRGMGFCILNNAAITARYLQHRYGLNRILILDYDVHHGNGTQEVFYESDQVMVVSLHQKDLFPGSGGENETGRDGGDGYTLNVPVPSQFGDREYTFLVGKILQGVVEQFMPQMILVSAGYDGHVDDTISATCLSTRWFGTVATMLKQYAAEYCDGRLLMILEGGYNTESLQASLLSTLDSLVRQDQKRVGVMQSERAERLLTDHPLTGQWHLL